MAKEPKQLRLADRRQLIIEAAIPINGQRGYYGFSIKSLAVACALTVPGVLHHFGSKEAILMAVLDYRERREFEAVWQGLPFRDAVELEQPQDSNGVGWEEINIRLIPIVQVGESPFIKFF